MATTGQATAMALTMDITPTRAITMMVRPSISVDTITPPAVSKTESPASSRAFSLFKAAAALPSLVSILADRPKIVFGVLEVILRRDPIPGESFGTGHGQIAFIASLEVLNITRLGTDEPGRLISSGGLRSAEHSAGHNFRMLARLPGEHSPSFALGASR